MILSEDNEIHSEQRNLTVIKCRILLGFRNNYVINRIFRAEPIVTDILQDLPRVVILVQILNFNYLFSKL
jgi:hypothetical protein